MKLPWHNTYHVRNCEDLLIQVRIFLRLPFPLKNHFYKGRSILGTRRNWLCSDCGNIFHLKPWKKWKHSGFEEIKCPACSSQRVYNGTELSKAIIDKRPLKDLKNFPNIVAILTAGRDISRFRSF